MLAQQIEDENEAIIKFFINDEEDFEFKSFSSLADFRRLTNMPAADFQEFKTIVLNYCKENLAKVIAFIPSPYVKKYILDEV